MDCNDEITVRGKKNKVGNGICRTKLFLKHQFQSPKGVIFNKRIGFEFWHSKSHIQSQSTPNIFHKQWSDCMDLLEQGETESF